MYGLTTICHYKIPYKKVSFFTYLILPFAFIKDFVEDIYDWILEMIWSELFHGEEEPNNLKEAFALIIVISFSLAIYHLQNYKDAVILFFIVLWWIDYLLAFYRRYRPKSFVTVSLEKDHNENMFWKKTEPGKTMLTVSFKKQDVEHVFVWRYKNLSGGFHTPIGTVWTIFLVLKNGKELLIFEDSNIYDAMAKVKELSAYFNVSQEYVSGKNRKEYYMARPSSHIESKNTVLAKAVNVRTQKNQFNTDIYTLMNFHTYTNIIKTAIKESGFLLFVLIMSEVLTNFGMFINTFIGPMLKLPVPENTETELSLSTFINIFKPNLDIKDYFEIAFAVAIICYRVWKLRKKKVISIDKNNIRFFENGKLISQVKTKETNEPLIVEHPYPSVLITDKNKAIEIKDLYDIDEFGAMAIRIADVIKDFQAAP